MKIQEQDRFHGPALMQIVEHDSFKALNKADDRYGHYLVNSDVRLWVKYASAEEGPWQFTLNPADLEGIGEDAKAKKSRVHMILVCGHTSICSVNLEELQELVDLKAGKSQWIRVEAPSSKRMRVTGPINNKDPLLVPHSRFPSCLFDKD